MNIEDLKKEVSKINWYQRIDLGNGIVTPGASNSPKILNGLGMPENLQGITVLDIGAWDGFYSFEAEHRGASRVLATDSFCWGDSGKYTKEGFDLARRALNSKVEDMHVDVLDISPEKIGAFDLVLFLGVLYHMRHPLLALEKVFSVTRNQLILETHVNIFNYRQPAMVFYPGSELAKDPTSWWGPNPAAVEYMLRDVGFRKVTIVSRCHSFPYKVARAMYFKVKKNESFYQAIRHDRIIFHAWK